MHVVKMKLACRRVEGSARLTVLSEKPSAFFIFCHQINLSPTAHKKEVQNIKAEIYHIHFFSSLLPLFLFSPRRVARQLSHPHLSPPSSPPPFFPRYLLYTSPPPSPSSSKRCVRSNLPIPIPYPFQEFAKNRFNDVNINRSEVKQTHPCARGCARPLIPGPLPSFLLLVLIFFFARLFVSPNTQNVE